MAAPLPFDEDLLMLAQQQRADLQARLNKLRYEATPGQGGGKGSHGTGGGAQSPAPSSTVVRTGPGPNDVSPLKASADVEAEIKTLQADIKALDDQIKDPMKNFGYVSGSQGQRKYATSSADHFVPFAGVAQANANPHLSQLLGLSSPGPGNMLSRTWNSVFDPRKAFQQYLATQGPIQDGGHVRATRAAGMHGYAPLDINNLDELYTHGISTGYITQADLADPSIVQRKLAELGNAVQFDQSGVVKQIGGKIGAAMDSMSDTRMKAMVGGGVAGTLAMALGGKEIYDYVSESSAKKAAAAKEKADKAKARAKLVGDASKKLFGDRRGAGFDGIRASAGKPSPRVLQEWSKDVDDLVGIGRGRMFSKLSPDQQRLAMQRLQTWEGQNREALKALSSGAARIEDHPQLTRDLQNFATEYDIDYSKTPYMAEQADDQGSVVGGVMIDMEKANSPFRRWGFRSGSTDLTDFTEEEAAGMAE